MKIIQICLRNNEKGDIEVLNVYSRENEDINEVAEGHKRCGLEELHGRITKISTKSGEIINILLED